MRRPSGPQGTDSSARATGSPSSLLQRFLSGLGQEERQEAAHCKSNGYFYICARANRDFILHTLAGISASIVCIYVLYNLEGEAWRTQDAYRTKMRRTARWESRRPGRSDIRTPGCRPRRRVGPWLRIELRPSPWNVGWNDKEPNYE